LSLVTSAATRSGFSPARQNGLEMRRLFLGGDGVRQHLLMTSLDENKIAEATRLQINFYLSPKWNNNSTNKSSKNK
jgi:hypothetical protein